MCDRRQQRRLLVIFPPHCARNRGLLCRRHLAVPSTSLQAVPGVRSNPPQSPLLGCGRARRRGYLCALHGVLCPKVGRKQTSPRLRRWGLPKSFLGPNIQQSAKQASVSEIEFWALDDGLGSIREPRFKQYNLTGCFQHRQPMVRCRRGQYRHRVPDLLRSTGSQNGVRRRAGISRSPAGCQHWLRSVHRVRDT